MTQRSGTSTRYSLPWYVSIRFDSIDYLIAMSWFNGKTVNDGWIKENRNTRAHTHTQTQCAIIQLKTVLFDENPLIFFIPFFIWTLSNIYINALVLSCHTHINTLDLQLRPIRTHTHIITGLIWILIRFSAWQIYCDGMRALYTHSFTKKWKFKHNSNRKR